MKFGSPTKIHIRGILPHLIVVVTGSDEPRDGLPSAQPLRCPFARLIPGRSEGGPGGPSTPIHGAMGQSRPYFPARLIICCPDRDEPLMGEPFASVAFSLFSCPLSLRLQHLESRPGVCSCISLGIEY